MPKHLDIGTTTMSDTLRNINPFVKPTPKPQSQTACGGLIAITILPICLGVYSLVWWANYYDLRQYAMESTDIFAIGVDQGMRLDGRRNSGQVLRCAADACYYTIFLDENNEVDRSCPPKAVVNQIRQNAIQLAQENGMSRVFIPGDAALSDLASVSEAGDAATAAGLPDLTTPVAINKRCAKVNRGEILEGACLYYSPDPIDSLSITWKADTNMKNFGVTLITETPHISAEDERRIYGGSSSAADGESYLEQLRARFAFRGGAGGGNGYVVREMPVKVHYGEVGVTASRYSYSHMNDVDGNSKPNATQLLPSYFNTQEMEPEDTNVCFNNGESSDAPADRPTFKPDKCNGLYVQPPAAVPGDPTPQDTRNTNCRQLKIKPMATWTLNTRSIASWQEALANFAGMLGGMVGLFMMAFGLFHTGEYQRQRRTARRSVLLEYPCPCTGH
jgi:hypothetical protein